MRRISGDALLSKRGPSPLPHQSPFELLAFRVVFEAGEADERLACGARLRPVVPGSGSRTASTR
jgi:hypothetical protein